MEKNSSKKLTKGYLTVHSVYEIPKKTHIFPLDDGEIDSVAYAVGYYCGSSFRVLHRVDTFDDACLVVNSSEFSKKLHIIRYSVSIAKLS